MRFGLLGPLEVTSGDRTVLISSPKLRILVAALALDAGRPVGIDELVAAVWADDPPRRPRPAVQLYVARLRNLFADAAPVIVTRADGYLLDVAPEQIDLGRFRRHLEEADRAAANADLEKESTALGDALAEWRGTPLVDVPSEVLQREAATWLAEQRLQVVERHVEVELRRGRHAELVGELRALTAQHPLRERLAGQLMTALDGSGRRADALATYQTVRRYLADELGIDPGAELQALHASILTGAAPPSPERTPVPRQIPPEVRGFAGRGTQLAALDALVRRGGTIGAITGTAGVGKTALAVRWAHRVADAFPDGQLWVNLRGYDPGQAVAPERAVARFLRALGVPDADIPPDPEERTGLYRSLLDGRRVLVVLDNARDPDQVRPLLPGTPGCLVLVTSRSQLTGLLAAEGAHPLTLDVLSDVEARELLTRRLGAARVVAERASAAEIIVECGRLPLALAIVASRAAAYPGFSLATLAGELREARGSLDVFDSGDTATDVRAVFSWSYRSLSPAAARLFRLLGLHPGADFAAPAAASLAGVPGERLRPLLVELTRGHLVTEHAPGRYVLHDLLRTYATELVRDEEREAATRRVLDHYVHSAHAATLELDPFQELPPGSEPAPGVTPVRPADHDEALRWFAAERSVLLAAIDHAGRTVWDGHAGRLAAAVGDFLDRQGYWHDWAATERAAVEAARRLDDPTAQARAHRHLARAYLRLGRSAEARDNLGRALDLYRRTGDPTGQAHTHNTMAFMYGRQDRYAHALDHAGQALDGYRTAGHRPGQANALNAVGWYRALLGDYDGALVDCRAALALNEELDDRQGQAAALDSLGYAFHHLDRRPEAVSCYERAIELYRAVDDRYFEADTLVHLGDAHEDSAAALVAWRRAAEILEDLDHPDAAAIRARLSDADQ